MSEPETNDSDTTSKEPTVTCQVCRRDVPESAIATIRGRRMCFGCASAWFEDEE